MNNNVLVQSRRDDLEMVGYVLIKLIKGNLPWWNYYDVNIIGEIKLRAIKNETYTIGNDTQRLFDDIPEEFYKYFQHINSLEYEEEPNYSYLRSMFYNLSLENNWSYDNNYDWKILEKQNIIPEDVLTIFINLVGFYWKARNENKF